VALFNRSRSRRAEPPNSQSIPPKSSSSLPTKSFSMSLYTTTKPPKQVQSHPMLLIWRWICFYPGRPENTGENRPITNLKPRKPSQTPHSPVKNLKVFTRRLHFCLKLFDITTNKLSILLSVADFANHARFVFSWPA